MKTMFRFFTLALLCLGSAMAMAQVNTATLSGEVKDPTGAVVPSASVQLTNVNTGVTRTASSDAGGRYAFDFVAVGTYRLNATSSGFQAVKGGTFTLVAGQNLFTPVTLQVGEVANSVTVSGEPPLIDTENSGQTDTIAAIEVAKIPTPRQDWTTLLEMNAGSMKPSSGTTISSTSAQGAGLSLNGLPTSGYNLSVDGTNATSNPEYTSFAVYQSPNIINTINNEAIQEISLTKGIQPATIGNTVSGNINIITKSGSNRFHGSLNYINQEALYNARYAFLTYKPRLTFNEYGGGVSGPILHEKLFFFFSYEGARLRSASPVSGVVPTPYLISQSAAAVRPLLALFPQVAQPAGSPTATSANYNGSGSAIQNDGNGVVRLDYNPTSHDSLAVRYIRARPYYYSPNLIPTNSRVQVAHTDAVNGNYFHTIGAITLNTRIGFNQLLFNRDDLGFNEQLPLASFGGINSKGSTLFLQHGNYITAEQAVALVKGKHNLQAGFIFQRQDASRYKLVTTSLTYSSISQFETNAAPSSVQPHYYALPANTPQFVFNDYQYGGYIQDDWKFSERLTFNLGFRYDHFTVPQETAGRFYNRGLDPANPQLGPGYGPFRNPNSIFDADYKAAQPRVGFAWQPFEGGKTVLSGGFGTFYANHTIFQGITGVASPSGTLPFFVTLSGNDPSGHSLVTDSGIKYGWDMNLYPTTIASMQAAGELSSQLAFTTINYRNPYPYSMQWQLRVQQQLASTLSMEIAYVGTRALNLDLFESKDQPDRITGVRPVPTLTAFDFYTTGDSSKYHGLQVSVTKTMRYGFSLAGNYVWSHNLTFGDADVLQASYVQDNSNIRGEYGPSPYDVRNRVAIHGIWTIPFTEWAHLHHGVTDALLKGWEISESYTGQSGAPVLITNPASIGPGDRPDRGSASLYSTNHSYSVNRQYLSCAAASPTAANVASCGFVDPVNNSAGIQVHAGSFPRYGVRMPGYENLNATLAKTTNFSHDINMRLHMDAFNALNHVNYNALNGSSNSSTFGTLTSAQSARTVQIGADIHF